MNHQSFWKNKLVLSGPLGKLSNVAPIAQSAERLHGKEKVKGSIPFRGSIHFKRNGFEAG